jgi:hypothetical protein
VNRFLRTDRAIYSEIKHVYSEYPALVNTFCCTDSFTINGIDCTKDCLRIELQFKAELVIKGFDEQRCLMKVFACLQIEIVQREKND